MCGPAWRRVEHGLVVQGKTNRQLLETSVVLLHLIESGTKFDWYSHSYQFFPFGSLVLCVYDRQEKLQSLRKNLHEKEQHYSK